MHPLRSKPLVIVLTLMSLAVVLSACSADQSSGNEGDFILNVYTGAGEVGSDTVSFNELVANEERPILLNIWAGNCPPCRAEMPALEAVWREYGDQVLFVGVDVGPYVGLGSYKQGQSLIDEIGVSYVTGTTANRGVITDWQISTMPSTFMLSRDGRVHDIVIGAISGSRLSQKVLELIATNAS